MSQVAVLMSTYNGERFLEEQIDSILSQKGVSSTLYIRDDGSSDNTRNQLKKMESHPNIKVEFAENVGAARSFLALLASASGHKYYAFSDQDDIWLPNKLCSAISSLKALDQSKPLLYFSNATCVDMNRVPLKRMLSTNRSPSLHNALIQCFSLGATMVINEAARKLLADIAMPTHIVMHDWWCYLVIATFGAVIYDSTETMQYRQHENNVYGSQGHIDYLRENFQHIIYGKKLRQGQEQAKDLLTIYDHILTADAKRTLKEFTTGKRGIASFAYALHSPCYKKEVGGTLIAKLQLALCNY